MFQSRNLVEELLQQTVQPGLGHRHRPRLVGDVAHLHHDLHQLENKDAQSESQARKFCIIDMRFLSE